VKIGLTYNLRSSAGTSHAPNSHEANSHGAGPHGAGPHEAGSQTADWPDDAEEEFDSPETIQTLSAVLESFGHEVELLGDGMRLLRGLVDGARPDLVFNFAEGTGTGRSREARVPAVLEMLDIPYTGSDPLTLSVTLDKPCAKQLIRGAGLATPDWLVVEGDVAESRERLATMPLPAIVKPACEGSSKGIHQMNLVEEPGRLLEVVERMAALYRQPVLVEEFIDGEELTVGIVGHRPQQVLGVCRVVPHDTGGRPFIYSLEVKRNMDWVRYECPAQLSPADTHAVEVAALAVWRTLGCRDVARIDFRLRNHVPYFLEVNPLPGLNPKTSDLPIMARALGIEYPELIGRIVQAAMERLAENTVAVGY
jgi:D-alanine-D-alanine ligase